MPYVMKSVRPRIEPHMGSMAMSSGELNYQITRLCVGYLDRHGLRYFTLNDIIGALECAKMELYRRVAAPYEDEKIKENGDVYDI
jgi:hypothetical protein